MKKYSISMTTEVVAATELEARQKFTALVQNAEVKVSGWQHPNGEFYECAPPPEGYTFFSVVSHYYGSHPERGEGDRELLFAIPTGTRAPYIELSHGHSSAQWEDLTLLPTGTLEWVENKGEWAPFVHESHQE